MSAEERWAPWPRCAQYEVSDQGHVRSLKSKGAPRLLREHIIDGYPRVWLQHPVGIGKIWSCHRLVLETFVGPCPDGMEACHNNGVRSDSRLANLRWDTRANNKADELVHGTRASGDRNAMRSRPEVRLRGMAHGMAKITMDDARRILELFAGKKSQRQIAGIVGVSQRQIGRVLRGESWHAKELKGGG